MGKLLAMRLFCIVAVSCLVATGGFSGYNNQTAYQGQAAPGAAMQMHLTADLPALADFAMHEASFVVGPAGFASCSFKQSQSFRAVIHAYGIHVVLLLANVVSDIINFPVRIKKSNLLFPFHYFF